MVDTDFGIRHNMVDTDFGIRHTLLASSNWGGTVYRNKMEDLIAWSKGPHRKPLIVNGARQVGKTWLVRTFGTEHFDALAHVVFLDNSDMQRAFAGSLDADRLLTIIGAATGTNPQDGRTLIFLDEIQECPRAITALKFFYEQRPDVPVIAAGSLLGVALNREQVNEGSGTSWPVGKVSYLNLYPMAFDEFVQELATPELASIVRGGDPDLIGAFEERLTDLLKAYLYVGGMPEAVQRYSESGDFAAARTVQLTLLMDYEHDFSKHVRSAIDVERIRQTWRSVPVQLARQTDIRRFSYASIREDGRGRGRDYRDAVAWLIDAGLVTKVPRLSKPGIPLASYAEEAYFKLYLLDIGLLGAATGLDTHTLIEGNRLFTEYKGLYAEQFVCQQLVASGLTPYYWSADGKQTKGEVDFVIEREGRIVPIEVKAVENVGGSSISQFSTRYDISPALRFSMLGWKDQGWILNIPLYAISGGVRI